MQPLLSSKKIIAVLILEDPKRAVDTARALQAGGIGAIELTLRTDSALESLRRIRAEVPELLVGAGTVLTPAQLKDAKKAGAQFAVAPGCNPRVIAAARDEGIFFAPGVMTPSDIEIALENGCRLLKFFPAATSGGLKHLEAMGAPYKHLGVSYIPLGGVTPENLAEMLAHPMVACVGGSWLAKPDQIAAGAYDQIRELAAQASAIAKRGK